MSSQCNFFLSYEALIPPTRIWLGDKHWIPAHGIGTTHLRLKLPDGKIQKTLVTRTYHIPSLDGNLLSVLCLTADGFSVSFNGKACHISGLGRDIVGAAHKDGNMYKFVSQEPKFPSMAMSKRMMSMC
ncbi:hypothetical protein OBBRIDRAFT_730003 [Obba rivulosa]|uniref:Retrovirus-related Pol polyprotein from transposon TNT 1-94-like beta-barrel domain-containing protein n=1 Tax=Obba rivulosa TaxID=1052685 RepID=A0A8E2DMC5_9APHY|nr:hypothetical protein OBBRIDRAFT_730003 [Obba rivulosa]